jgi:glutamyl-tRNA reductase
MHRIAVAGLSLHDTDVAGLERAKRRLGASGSDAFGAAMREIADELGASELAIVSTCNRLEIVYAREEGHLPSRADLALVERALAISGDDLTLHFHFFCELEAARHLFRVSSSLDSLVLGEDQILAQVREAHRVAERQGLIGRLLDPLFQAAFRIGKDVRTNTGLGKRPISVTSLALDRLNRRFPDRRAALAIVGAGEMSSLAARGAKELGFQVEWIVNRSRERDRQSIARAR